MFFCVGIFGTDRVFKTDFLFSQEYDLECIKILIAFGANVNATDQRRRTPIDLVCADLTDFESSFRAPPTVQIAPTLPQRMQLHRHDSFFESVARKSSRENVVEVLRMAGGVSADLVHRFSPPSVEPFPRIPLYGSTLDAKQRSNFLRWAEQLTTRYSELDNNIRRRFKNTSHAGETQSLSSEEAVPLALQLSEMEKFKRAGSRILCLDGGGIRGLIQLEVLSQLEKKTGRKITELFDWIIGTSTGGLIALGLVYGKMPQG